MHYLNKPALITLFLLISSFLYAQNIVRVKSTLQQDYFGTNVYLYQDTSNKLSFEKISKSPGLFKASKLAVPNLGISLFNNWIKFRLVNDSELNKVILDIPNPIIDEADLYMINGQHIDSIKNSN